MPINKFFFALVTFLIFCSTLLLGEENDNQKYINQLCKKYNAPPVAVKTWHILGYGAVYHPDEQIIILWANHGDTKTALLHEFAHHLVLTDKRGDLNYSVHGIDFQEKLGMLIDFEMDGELAQYDFKNEYPWVVTYLRRRYDTL